MPVNRISVTLGGAERQAVLAAIQTIRQKLPFQIDLTPVERRALPRFGEKGRGFVEQALQVAGQNSDTSRAPLTRGRCATTWGYSPRSRTSRPPSRSSTNSRATRSWPSAATRMRRRCSSTSSRAAGKGSALDSTLDALGQRFARKEGGAFDESFLDGLRVTERTEGGRRV